MKPIKLCLYVSGASTHSEQALRHLEILQERYPNYLFSIEVRDILQQPELAAEAKVLGVPTLIKTTPKPVCRIIGDLSDVELLADGLGLLAPEPDDFRLAQTRGYAGGT